MGRVALGESGIPLNIVSADELGRARRNMKRTGQ